MCQKYKAPPPSLSSLRFSSIFCTVFLFLFVCFTTEALKLQKNSDHVVFFSVNI